MNTVGDHIRAWRINNKLFQADIAKRLGVCEDTVVGWEMRNRKPTVKQMPGIIQMIGYLPIEVDASTFGGRITRYRYKHGLTPKELGLLLSADASTVRAWEAGKNMPHKSRIKDIEDALRLNKLEVR
ncbi:MAG TPA: helix-turn-helix domain-containing protein [Chitinophagaceae bacterium]|nr:helix-turn-helix domain-containing protein [Chitinophagaceae bacterium]